MLVPKKAGRIWSHGSNAVISTLLFLSILTFVALIAEQHPWRADFSESGVYSLSEQTRKIVESLEEPVHIKAFYASSSPEESEARGRLETYRYYNKKIDFEFIDPDRNPEAARRYDVRSYGTLVLAGYQKQQTVLGDDEEAITNALLKLSREGNKKIYFLKGHGERDVKGFDKMGYSSLRSALEKENYDIEELSLMTRAQVPDNASLVVVAGPEKPLFKEEIESLKTYLSEGGKVMAFLDPDRDGGLGDFMRSNGIELREDIVIDQLSRVFGGNYLMPVVTEYGSHKITEDFGIATFYSEARSVYPESDPPPDVVVFTLASTSANAWAETDMDLLNEGKAAFDENEDKAGPVPLVVLAEVAGKGGDSPSKGGDDETGRSPPSAESARQGYLLVAGDSDFVDNTHFGLSGNGDFFLNIVNFLAEEENLITIEPRRREGQPLILTRVQGQLVFWTSMVFVPLMVLLSGLMVYRGRRMQR